MECGFIDDSFGCRKLIFKFCNKVIVEYLVNFFILGSCMLQQLVPVTF
jgi:hypothetical protein